MPDATDGWTCAAGCASRSAARPHRLPRVEGRQSTIRRDDQQQQVCRATSRRLCHNYCTDRPLLARAAGSSTIPTGIERSNGSEQLRSSGTIVVSVESDLVRSCGRHGLLTATRGCGDRSSDAVHVLVLSSPVACASGPCPLWTPWAVALTRSAQSGPGIVHATLY
eukprot:5776836-Prymnesium_polylepis.1